MQPGERGEVYFEKQDRGWKAIQYYRDHGGRRRRGTGFGEAKAAAKRNLLRNVEAALAVGGSGYLPSSKFEVAVRDWLATIERGVEKGSRSPTTYDTYERSVRVHVLPALGQMRLSDMSTGKFDQFLSDLHHRTGYATAKTARTVLNGTCQLLMRRDVLRSNPMRDVGRLERGEARSPRALTVAELQVLLGLFDASDYARRKDLPDLVRFLLATGVRIGEALAVRWADVDLEAGIVIVEATVVRVRGKGLVRKSTKSDASDRTLRLPTWAVEILTRRFDGQDAVAPVFPDSRGGWRDRSNVGRDLREVVRGTAYEWVRSHTARRTVATILDIQGLTAREIADQLGHARPSMTQDVYMGRRVVSGAAGHLEGLASVTELPQPKPGATAG
jgi:integrase